MNGFLLLWCVVSTGGLVALWQAHARLRQRNATLESRIMGAEFVLDNVRAVVPAEMGSMLDELRSGGSDGEARELGRALQASGQKAAAGSFAHA